MTLILQQRQLQLQFWPLKMGAETGLKVHMGDEAKSDSAQARSSEVEGIPSNGLRNRKETKAKGSSYSSTIAAHTQQGT